MQDLIARLEAATEGSRDLDFAIWKAIGQPSASSQTRPPYTTSLDWALTLAPEGYIIRLDGLQKPAALALCIAALKARATSEAPRTPDTGAAG